MAPTTSKKRKADESHSKNTFNPQKRRPLRTKSRFDSDSDDHTEDEAPSKPDYRGTDFPGTIPDSKPRQKVKVQPLADAQLSSSEDDDGDEHDLSGDSETDASSDINSDASSSRPDSKKRKRNDPEAFATSISKILSSKLSTSKRSDPVLSRSKEAAAGSLELADARLDVKARHKLREEKKAELDKGRVRDVLGVEEGVDGGGIVQGGETVQETEKRLRKTAQRGVVKLFNAVRASQVRAEQAAQEAKESGIVGVGRREERVTEMSKKGFLDLLAGGGGGGGSVKVSRLEGP